MSNKLACGSCFFFKRYHRHDNYTPVPLNTGECRKYAPKPYTTRNPSSYSSSGIVHTVFPVLNIDDWCGEHSELKYTGLRRK